MRFFLSSSEDIFSFLLEREEGREEGRKTNIDVQEKYRSVASLRHQEQGLNLQP